MSIRFFRQSDAVYAPPEWMSKYPTLAHCSYCDAVYSKDTEWVKVRHINEGTRPTQKQYVRDCKPNSCPMCER